MHFGPCKLSNTVNVLSRYLEDLDGKNLLKLNSDKIKWLWVWGLTDCRTVPSLVLDAPDRSCKQSRTCLRTRWLSCLGRSLHSFRSCPSHPQNGTIVTTAWGCPWSIQKFLPVQNAAYNYVCC